jgi:exopolyphosphatase/pppGpp-phosphohydrolase
MKDMDNTLVEMHQIKKFDKDEANVNYELAKKHAFAELRILPKSLNYHNLEHTKEVLETSEMWGKLEKLNEKEFLLLKTAAVYHDIGFAIAYKEHEQRGAQFVIEYLYNWEYNPEEIGIIAGMILATKIPQNPKTKLQRILCDADLDNFGREDFFVKGELLKTELHNHGIEIPQKDWYEHSLKLLEEHHYFTPSARKFRREGKEKNIAKLKNLLLE